MDFLLLESRLLWERIIWLDCAAIPGSQAR